jgi:hypothetical protein
MRRCDPDEAPLGASLRQRAHSMAGADTAAWPTVSVKRQSVSKRPETRPNPWAESNCARVEYPLCRPPHRDQMEFGAG